jgi:CheY-like chemotaxis protein
MRLLIAENDPSLATFLNNGFGGEHYTVDVSSDGAGAQTMVQENEYDAAILDLNLPQAEGMEVLQKFRSEPPQLPILILTSRNRPEGARTSAGSWGGRFGVEALFVCGAFRAGPRPAAPWGTFPTGDAAHGQSGSQSSGTLRTTRESVDRPHAERVWFVGVFDAQRGSAGNPIANHRACLESVVRHHDQRRRRLH